MYDNGKIYLGLSGEGSRVELPSPCATGTA